VHTNGFGIEIQSNIVSLALRKVVIPAQAGIQPLSFRAERSEVEKSIKTAREATRQSHLSFPT
jgi:hypothetical protein